MDTLQEFLSRLKGFLESDKGEGPKVNADSSNYSQQLEMFDENGSFNDDNYSDWHQFKYSIMDLHNRYSIDLNPKSSINFLSFEEAFSLSLDTSLTFSEILFNENDTPEEEEESFSSYFYSSIVISYKMAIITKKMIDREPGFDNYLDEKDQIENISSFTIDFTEKFLELISVKILTQQTNKWIYKHANDIVFQLSKITLRSFEIKEDPAFEIRKVWIEYFQNIKIKIEGDILFETKSKVFKKKWYPTFIYKNPFSFDISYSSRKDYEMFLPHPKSNSIDDTKKFIKVYLAKKAIESGLSWIKNILKFQPKGNSDKTVPGYYKYLGAFFYTMKTQGIIKEDIMPNQFEDYLETNYKNKLSRNGDLNEPFFREYNKKQKHEKNFELFLDMGEAFKSDVIKNEKNTDNANVGLIAFCKIHAGLSNKDQMD
jgi:hypothetical protein